MAKYRVVKAFRDKEDDSRLYGYGGKYPIGQVEPSKERIEFLINKGRIEGLDDDSDGVVAYPSADNGSDDDVEIISMDNTRNEIMDYLDRHQIEYLKSNNKDELMELVAE